MNKRINCTLIVLLLACMVVSIKLSSIPAFDFVDNNSFWISAEKTIYDYSFIYDFCSGMSLSIIFYFFVDVLPALTKENRNRRRLAKYWNEIVKKMEEILSITIKLYTNKKIDDLQYNDLAKIRGDTSFSSQIIYYDQEIFKNNKRITGFRQYMTFDNLIKNNIREIIKQLGNIKSYSDSFTNQNGMVEFISDIETNRFVTIYGKSDIKCYTYYDSDDMFYSFYCLYNDLIKKHFNEEISKTKVLEGEEKEEYANKITNNTEVFSKLANFNSEKIKCINDENIIVIYDNLEFVKKITPYLDCLRDSNAKYINLDDRNKIDINSQMHIYILSEKRRSIKADNSVYNIVFQPKCQFKKSMEKEKNNVYYINYQKTMKIFNVYLFKDNPTKETIERIQAIVTEHIMNKYSLELKL